MENNKRKRPTNKEVYEILENGYKVAMDWNKNKENQEPDELTCFTLNCISYGLRTASKDNDLNKVIAVIANYANLFRFGEKKQKSLFENTMNTFIDRINNNEGINPFEFFEILLTNTKALVK